MAASPIDKSNMISILRNYPNMVKEAESFADGITLPKEFVEDIIVSGMGGSGFSGDLLKVYLQDTHLRIHVVKDYNLPQFVNRKSLVFAVSYSGNTEETVSLYRSAIRRGCKVITISSGGKLQELAKMNKNQHVVIPKGLPPRMSTPYLFVPMVKILSDSGLIDEQDSIIKKTSQNLKSAMDKIESGSKDLASKLKGKTPLIYSSGKMFCLAEKWKTDINENAKIHAFYNVFPEFNHNELCAYDVPKDGYYVIILNDVDDYERVKARIKIFKKLIQKTPNTEIAITGENMMTRLLSTIWMGLNLSYYLALEYNIDPTPVNIIENLKKELEK